jgi:hypothetical protein
MRIPLLLRRYLDRAVRKVAVVTEIEARLPLLLLDLWSHLTSWRTS